MTIRKTLKTIRNYLLNPCKSLEEVYDIIKEFHMYIIPNAWINGQRKTAVLRSRLGLSLVIRAESPLPIGGLEISGTRLRKQYESDKEFYDAVDQVIEGKRSKEECLEALINFRNGNDLFMRYQEFVGVHTPPTQKEEKVFCY